MMGLVKCNIEELHKAQAENKSALEENELLQGRIARLEHYIKTTGNLGDKPQWIRDLFHESNSQSLAKLKADAIEQMLKDLAENSMYCSIDRVKVGEIEDYIKQLRSK